MTTENRMCNYVYNHSDALYVMRFSPIINDQETASRSGVWPAGGYTWNVEQTTWPSGRLGNEIYMQPLMKNLEMSFLTQLSSLHTKLSRGQLLVQSSDENFVKMTTTPLQCFCVEQIKATPCCAIVVYKNFIMMLSQMFAMSWYTNAEMPTFNFQNA